ncbi:MAG: hypothetical protein KJ043_01020 [Anaerolineae bacterium]|nr:hypothetical protein [Anaerolineae bacterium]
MQSVSSSPISGMPNQGGRVVRGNGGFSPIRLPFALILGAIGGIATGVALFFSGKLVYLILVSAIFTGFIAGGFAILAVKVGKVRNGLLGFLLGIVVGAIAYGAYWGAEYVNAILELGTEARTQIRAELGASASDADVEREMNVILEALTGSTDFMGLLKLVDLDLQDQTGNTGIVGYISYQAQQGFSISRVGRGSSSSEAPIKDGLAWGYYGLELVIIAIASGLMAGGVARQPFCSEQNRWLKLKPVAQVVEPAINSFMQAFQNGDLRAAAQYIQPVDARSPLPKLHIEVGRCSEQSIDGSLKITFITRNNKNQNTEKVLFNGEISQIDQLFNR